MASSLRRIPPGNALFEPRAKLLALLFAFILLILARSIPTLLAAGLFVAVLLAASRVSFTWISSRLGVLLLALLPFLLTMPLFITDGKTIWEWRFLRITERGLEMTAILFLRSTTIALWVLWLLATTTWADGVIAARRLGLPRRLSSILILTHRHVALLDGELNRIRLAVRLRGFRNGMDRHSQRTIGQLIGTLFVRGFDRSENLHRAMRMRGFAGDLPSLRKPRWRGRDWLFAGLALLFHSSLLAVDWSLR